MTWSRHVQPIPLHRGMVRYPAHHQAQASARGRTGAALAGIWEDAEYKADRRIAFAILTDEPNKLVAPYPDRMPLALADDKVEVWLDLGRPDPLAEDLLLDLDAFTVGTMDRAINNARETDLSAIDPDRWAA
jgi:putative SOS response-associated peptidase YedK